MKANDDNRMKDLANRLVGMSPQPPPFPEETTVTIKPSVQKPRPLLKFAGAAALVLVGALIPILIANRNQDQQPAASTVVPGTTTTTLAGPTETTTPGPVDETVESVVYLVQSPQESFTGNPSLVPFRVSASAPADTPPELVALQMLMPVDAELSLPDGFYDATPAGIEVQSVVRQGNLITIDFNEEFRKGTGIGLLADTTMLNQIIFTATQFGAEEVLLTIGGEPVGAFGSEGDVLDGPVTRETYLTELNPILVTDLEKTEAGTVIVTGLATTFEATVSYLVVSDEDVILDRGFTTASCGTGCWGDYNIEIDLSLITGPSSIRIYESSAKDGSPIFDVSIPVSPEGLVEISPSASN